MIRFRQFVAYMKKEQVSRFEGRLTVNVEKVKINNGVFMTSLQGRRPDSQEWVTIGLDSYYMAYREGMPLKRKRWITVGYSSLTIKKLYTKQEEFYLCRMRD